MKTLRKLTALLTALAIFATGCGKDSFSADDKATTTQNITSTEESTIPADVGTNKPNYDFSIYDDNRSFTKEEIKVQSQFENYLHDIFVEDMTSNSITLHFSLENPSEYGIEPIEPTWGDLNFTDISDDIKDVNDSYTELLTFDYDSLTYEQQLIYDILKLYLENEKKGADGYLCYSAFAPMSGVHSELPIIFSGYDFREQRDIEDYLQLLSTSYDYVKACCDYELARLDEGHALSVYSLKQVIEQCEEFINSNPNSLRPVFEEDINNFEGLSQEEISNYLSKFDDAMKESLIPAYKLIIDTMNTIIENKGTNSSEGGVCLQPGGKKYYEYLVRDNTGSSLSVDELFEKIEDLQSKYLTKFLSMMALYPNLYSELSDYVYPTNEPTEMLELLIDALEEDFPSAVSDRFKINYVPESLQSMMNPAYYLVPPIDNYNVNNIYINNNPDYAHMNLFSTVAHEGFPGHMYQTNYFYSTEPHYFRSDLNFSGYTEGWAHYIENSYSYKYAGMNKSLAKASEINGYMGFSIYCLCDIGINYYGWTLSETKDYVRQTFNLDDATIEELFYTLADDPAVYLRYYVGASEIITLKETAMDTLGEGFDIKEFHRFLLEIGPCQFDVIADRMEDWMDRVMGN